MSKKKKEKKKKNNGQGKVPFWAQVVLANHRAAQILLCL